MERLGIELHNIEHRIKWNEIVKLIAEKYTGYLVYALNPVYSEINLRLYQHKPEYIIGRIEGWWQSPNKNKDVPETSQRLSVHWSRVDIKTFPAPWSSLTKI